MNMVKEFTNQISQKVGVDKDIFFMINSTIITILLFIIIQKIVNKIIINTIHDDKLKYTTKQKIGIVLKILKFAILFFVWDSYIKSIMTLISFISAALTIALRDIVFNWFSGIYIRVKKLFDVEDRISINNITGDVVNIKTLHFEILETTNKDGGEQSTGILIDIPNSFIFSKEIKNYNKGFKYIWDELKIKITLNSSIEATKGYIYEVLKQNKTIKAIPQKMSKQINEINADYRIYYNNLEPIIYTKIIDNYIELSIRYLVHPKKLRITQNELTLKILELHKDKKISLYQG